MACLRHAELKVVTSSSVLSPSHPSFAQIFLLGVLSYLCIVTSFVFGCGSAHTH